MHTQSVRSSINVEYEMLQSLNEMELFSDVDVFQDTKQSDVYLFFKKYVYKQYETFLQVRSFRMNSLWCFHFQMKQCSGTNVKNMAGRKNGGNER